MRIYIGWKIKQLSDEIFDNINGAEIIGNGKIRKTYFYTVKLKSGELRTIRREPLLDAYSKKQIEFYV